MSSFVNGKIPPFCIAQILASLVTPTFKRASATFYSFKVGSKINLSPILTKVHIATSLLIGKSIVFS